MVPEQPPADAAALRGDALVAQAATSAGRVHVRSWGSGPDLLLLHSNGHSWHEFDEVVEPLARRFRVHAWDMPGQGDSDPVDPGTTIAGYADVLVEVLDDLALERPVVVGCSIGAFIAADLGVRHPERTAGVALVEFAYRDAAWWREHWAGVVSLFSTATQSHDAVAARHVRPITDAYLERWNADRNQAGVPTLIGVMEAIRAFDMTAALRAVRCPLVVVYGANGPTLECRPAVEQVLPEGARVIVLPKAGHFPAFDAPDAFVDAVEALAAAARAR